MMLHAEEIEARSVQEVVRNTPLFALDAVVLDTETTRARPENGQARRDRRGAARRRGGPRELTIAAGEMAARKLSRVDHSAWLSGGSP